MESLGMGGGDGKAVGRAPHPSSAGTGQWLTRPCVQPRIRDVWCGRHQDLERAPENAPRCVYLACREAAFPTRAESMSAEESVGHEPSSHLPRGLLCAAETGLVCDSGRLLPRGEPASVEAWRAVC